MALLGMNAALYRDTAIAGTPPTTPAGMTLVSNVKDLSTDFTAGEADITTRANGGWRGTMATLREATITFQMVWDSGDAGFTTIQTAFLSSGMVAFAILDQAIGEGGEQGLIGNFSITNFSQTQNLEEAQMVDVTIKLAEFGAWYKQA